MERLILHGACDAEVAARTPARVGVRAVYRLHHPRSCREIDQQAELGLVEVAGRTEGIPPRLPTPPARETAAHLRVVRDHLRHAAVDADAHILEPPDLWEEWIDPQYRDRALR